jgi:membrane-bound ClpP family serine protease
MKLFTSAESESLGGAGILLGAVGSVLMLVAAGTGLRLALGVAGLCLFVIGLLLAIVQSWRIARAGGVGFFRSFFRCIRRALSFLFWMLP